MTTPLGLYEALVPPLQRSVGALAAVLAKAAAHARGVGVEPSVYLAARLAPDMWPLVRQVQVASDFAKNGPLRLLGRTPPAWPDAESSFEELIERLDQNRALLNGLTPETFAGRDTAPISFPIGPETRTMSGAAYATQFVLPNFYFHVTMAYAILRHNGVALTKADFLGPA